MTVREFVELYGLSVQSISRRLKEAKEKCGSFPSPDFRYKRKTPFHKSETEQRESKQGR